MFQFVKVAYSGTKDFLELLNSYQESQLDETLKRLKAQCVTVQNSFKDKSGRMTRQFTLEIGDKIIRRMFPALQEINTIVSNIDCEVGEIEINLQGIERVVKLKDISLKQRSMIQQVLDFEFSTGLCFPVTILCAYNRGCSNKFIKFRRRL